MTLTVSRPSFQSDSEPDPNCAALYCATNPSVRGSSGLRFKTWTGAYPKLTEHFASANLNPSDNKWDKVWHWKHVIEKCSQPLCYLPLKLMEDREHACCATAGASQGRNHLSVKHRGCLPQVKYGACCQYRVVGLTQDVEATASTAFRREA